MIINRHNYEEFFLLYVDHELLPGERKTVEAFVRENSDLEEELVMLQQSKLKPDHDVFYNNKKSLLKQSSGNARIDEMNYEEFFVLYVDGELSEEEKTDVEKFIFQYPHLRLELDLLQQTSLQPDFDVVFEKKEILFRHEEKRAGNSLLPWVRYSAAAAIFLLAGLLIFNKLNNHASRSLAVHNKLRVVEPFDTTKKNHVETVTPAMADALQYGRQGSQKKNHVKEETMKELPGSATSVSPGKVTSNDVAIELSATKVMTTLPKTNDKEVHTGDLVGHVNPVSDQVITITDRAMPATQENEPNHFVTQASLNNMNIDPENGFSILTASSGKTKMRGFFRKVSRVFEKNTGIDDGNSNKSVLVGNFQIALK